MSSILPHGIGRRRGPDAHTDQREQDLLRKELLVKNAYLYDTSVMGWRTQVAVACTSQQLLMCPLYPPARKIQADKVWMWCTVIVGTVQLDVGLFWYDRDARLLRLIPGSNARWQVSATGRLTADVDCVIRPEHEILFFGYIGGTNLTLSGKTSAFQVAEVRRAASITSFPHVFPLDGVPKVGSTVNVASGAYVSDRISSLI
jgi:hypothetical protein